MRCVILKEITPVNHTLTNAVMTVSTVSLASNISYKDSVAYQVQWTGPGLGDAQIQGSVDYNPGTPQSNGTYNAGNWTTITSGSTSSSPLLFNLNQLSMPYIRLNFVAGSGAGTLNAYMFAKSLG